VYNISILISIKALPIQLVLLLFHQNQSFYFCPKWWKMFHLWKWRLQDMDFKIVESVI